ncbi:MAG: DUF4254 domain-containing protein [Cyclobacteriaceae bacterium]|nr:DUF4254 domain-containing protein [Cyclobacteriaceae bacterium]MCH8516373.1 DUF4254 domain-containing protein [Cyclobacteriaceae bacterium]
MNILSAEKCIQLFNQSINDYHKTDSIEAPSPNPYQVSSLEYLLYKKNWIDTVQWHLEDLIRDPEIEPKRLVELKRKIDASNQDRTDTVEKIDDFIIAYFDFKNTKKKENARMNSETPAWLLDRMSILMLKVYHMHEQTLREDADEEHIQKCELKLAILKEQQIDLTQCFDELIEDILNGNRFVKVYRQMKMYNDEKLNPILSAKKK